jgi:hypothetical protein
MIARLPDLELRRMDGRRDAAGARRQIVPDQSALNSFVKVALGIQRQRNCRNDRPGLQNLKRLPAHINKHLPFPQSASVYQASCCRKQPFGLQALSVSRIRRGTKRRMHLEGRSAARGLHSFEKAGLPRSAAGGARFFS